MVKEKKAATKIAEHYRQYIQQKGKRPAETFTDPFTKKEEQNQVSVPVAFLNQLLRELHK
jgi:adenosine deaminase